MKRYTWRTAIVESGMIAAAVLFVLPLYILVNLAIRRPSDLTSPLLPTRTPTIDNFVTAWVSAGLGSAILQSLFVTVASVSLIVAITALASYPLARITSRLSRWLYLLVMIGLLLPFQLVFIPLYRTFNDLGLLGTPWSLIILYAGHQVPLSVFLYTSFLRAIPKDYEEAAALDGCTPFQALWRVMFPLLRPVTGTVVILNVILIWNDFMTPLLYLGGSDTETIPVALYSFVGEFTTQWQIVFAGLVIGMLPVLIAFFMLQGRVMQGFAAGVKG